MGLIHIYTGDGKGKTSAAVGLMMRAHGCGMKCAFVQFLKGSETGELETISKLGIKIMRNSRDYGFWSGMDESHRSAVMLENTENLLAAAKCDIEGTELIVLDEVIPAYNLGAVEKDVLINFLRDHNCELVLTGRNVPAELMCYADYVSEIKKIRHPFDKGINARRGIEY